MVPSPARRDGLANLNVAFLWKGARGISIRGESRDPNGRLRAGLAAAVRFINIRRAAAFYDWSVLRGVRPPFSAKPLDAYLN